MNCKHLYAFFALALSCLLASCHSQADLDNIDLSAEVKMGLALPVGSIRATVGDFVGGGQVQHLYINTEEGYEGVITWKDTFKIERDYCEIDLASRIAEKTLSMKVYDQLQAKHLIGPDGKVTGHDIPVTLDFPLTLKLKDINQPGNTGKERLDSALIEDARFNSRIQTTAMDEFQWDWIDKVTIDLGEQIRRPEGNTMVIYSKNDGYGFGQEIPLSVDQFYVVLMKNKHLTDWTQFANNVIDSCQFTIHFTFTVPSGEQVAVSEDAGFNYNLAVQFMKYTAIWGMFEPSKDMHAKMEVDLGSSWREIEFLTRASVPFADPNILVDINTQVAGAMIIDSAYLYVAKNDNDTTFAVFGKNESRQRYVYFRPDQYLPLSSAIGDSTTNMYVVFNKEAENGRIDRLFQGIPQKLGYQFAVKFNQQETPQIRILRENPVKVNAICTLPLILSNGLHIDFNDTIKGVEISAYSIDSLLAKVDFVDSLSASEVRLILESENTIPICAKAVFRFLDENKQVILDPATNDTLQLFDTDTIRLSAPNYIFNNGTWSQDVNNPGRTTIIAAMTNEKMKLFPRIKAIQYTVILDDESLQESYQRGLKNVRITEDNGLKISFGLTADIDAYMNFNQKQQQQ